MGQLSFGQLPSGSDPAGDIDTSPLKQHQQKPPRSPESLKRSRESLEIPLALKLDVLAGPAQDSSFTTPRGAVQVGQRPSAALQAVQPRCCPASPSCQRMVAA